MPVARVAEIAEIEAAIFTEEALNPLLKAFADIPHDIPEYFQAVLRKWRRFERFRSVPKTYLQWNVVVAFPNGWGMLIQWTPLNPMRDERFTVNASVVAIRGPGPQDYIVSHMKQIPNDLVPTFWTEVTADDLDLLLRDVMDMAPGETGIVATR